MMARRGAVWWLAGVPEPVCQRWQWRKGGTVLENTTDDVTTRYEVEPEGDGRFTLYGPSWKSRSPSGGAGVAGCAQPVVVVGADETQWTVVTTLESVAAYHVDDADHWYRTSEACQAALRAGVPPPDRGC